MQALLPLLQEHILQKQYKEQVIPPTKKIKESLKFYNDKPASNPAETIIISGLNSLATGSKMWSHTAK